MGEEKQEFKIGDIVTLKSDDVEMTISHIVQRTNGNHMYFCVYRAAEGRIHKDNLSGDVLVKKQ